MNSLKSLFAAPTFEDEAKTQQAYLLNVIVWALICVPIPFVVYTLLLLPENTTRTFLQTGFGEVVNIILLIMLRRGLVRAASVIQVSTFWLFFTVTAITGNSVRGEAYLLGYGLVIAIAGMLLGGTGALIFTCLSLAAGGVMVWQEMVGALKPILEGSPLTPWIVSLVLFPIGAVLQYLASHQVQNTLVRARASEERYRLISKVSSDYIFSTDMDKAGNLHLSWVAGAFKEISGYTYEEYMASGGWLAHLHLEDKLKDDQDMSALRKGKPVVSEVRTYRKDGALRWVQVSAYPVWDEKQNRMSGIVGGVKDITERKRAEDDLLISEATYRQAIEIAGGVPYRQSFDENGQIIYDFMSEGIREITGYGPDKFSDDLWGTLTQERHLLEDLSSYSLDEAIERVRTGKTPIWKCEHRIRARDGKIHWVFEAAVDLRDEHGIAHGSIGLYQDITERKQAEEALRYERDLLQIFMDNIPDTVYFKDAESRFVRVNRAQAQFLKLKDPQAAIGKTDLDFQSSDVAQQFIDEEKQIIKTGQPIINRIEFNPTEDGKPRWLSATKVSVRDSSGQVIGTIGVSRDITEQKEAQDNLQRIFLQQGAILNNIPDIAWLKDKNSLYIAVNEQFSKRVGMKMEDILGKTDLEIWKTDYAESYRDTDLEIMQTHQRKNAEELEIDSLGNERWIETSKAPILNAEGEVIGIAGIARNITERKKAEQAEQTRRKMLEKVVHLGKKVTEVSNLETALEKVWHGIHDELGFDRPGIFLYNPNHNAMDGTYGTNNNGEMVNEWDIHISLDSESTDALAFINVLNEENGLNLTHNYVGEHNIPKEHIMYGVKDHALVAVWAGTKPVGVISVDNLITGRSLPEEQLEALRLFAGYAGLAIENARLNDKLQKELAQQKQEEEREARRRAILESVFQLGKHITELTDLKTTIERIWHGVHDDLEFDRLAIFLYNPEHNTMDDTVGTDNQGQMVPQWKISFPIGSTFSNLLEKPDGLYFTRNYDIENNIPEGHEMFGVKDYVAVAAWAGTKPMAVICADNLITQRPISSEQLEALRLYAGYAGLAIENSRLNSALQGELTQRKSIIEELETKNAELERFTYTVSHDLKSPLVTITGFLGYLEQDAFAGNVDKVKSTINRISSAARKMQSLLNDLLELSRIGRLMNSPEEVPFEEIVHEAVDRVHGKLDEINAILEIQTDLPVVHGDRTRLIEVVQNLVENAAKYSNPGSKPRIEIGAREDAQNQFVFYVRDNGIGIAPKYHENIFGLFNKLNATSEGTGIGLTLVKRIVEVHGGHIWVESETGEGATFCFTLPTKPKE